MIGHLCLKSGKEIFSQVIIYLLPVGGGEERIISVKKAANISFFLCFFHHMT